MNDWKSIVKAVAPALATALGGPLAGLAVNAVSNSVLGKSEGSDDEIASALSNPDALVKLKQADHDFKAKMIELGVNLENIAEQDRASARAREVTLKDKTVPALALLYTTAYFFALWAVWHFGMPPDAETRSVLTSLLGVISTVQVTIVAYYFGSSAGSASKNQILQKALGQ